MTGSTARARSAAGRSRPSACWRCRTHGRAWRVRIGWSAPGAGAHPDARPGVLTLAEWLLVAREDGRVDLQRRHPVTGLVALLLGLEGPDVLLEERPHELPPGEPERGP